MLSSEESPLSLVRWSGPAPTHTQRKRRAPPPSNFEAGQRGAARLQEDRAEARAKTAAKKTEPPKMEVVVEVRGASRQTTITRVSTDRRSNKQRLKAYLLKLKREARR